jgi:acetyl esterase/lipase
MKATRLGRDELLALASVPPARRYPYGGDPAQFADLYLPDGEAVGVVVLLHGGCWRDAVTLDYFGQFARALTELGIAVWNVEYRRLGSGGGWPTTFQDVAAALAKLASVAPEHALPLARLVLVGHSAGGHLALWLAAQGRLPPCELKVAGVPTPCAVVSLAGLPDLAEAHARGLCRGAPAELMGGAPAEVPERYALGSPQQLVPLGVAQLHLCGTDDDVVPLDYAQSCAEQAAERGDCVTFIPLEGVGHYEPVVVSSSAWPAVSQAVMQFTHPLSRSAERLPRG